MWKSITKIYQIQWSYFQCAVWSLLCLFNIKLWFDSDAIHRSTPSYSLVPHPFDLLVQTPSHIPHFLSHIKTAAGEGMQKCFVTHFKCILKAEQRGGHMKMWCVNSDKVGWVSLKHENTHPTTVPTANCDLRFTLCKCTVNTAHGFYRGREHTKNMLGK